MALLYAISLGIWFSALRLSLLKSMAIIVVFYYCGEQILGGEWLFKGVEAKTLAYAAVIAALGLAIRHKWIPVLLLMVLATYFHFLVGGFWMLAIALFMMLQTGEIKLPVKALLGYLLLILPLVIMLVINQLEQLPIAAGPGPNQVYAVRVSHHTMPFASMHQFRHWLPGIIETGVLALIFLLLKRSETDRVLVNFVSLLLIYLLVALFLSYIDRNTLLLAKLFLFRPSSLILLLALTVLLILLYKNVGLKGKRILQVSQAAIVIFFLGNLFWLTVYAVYSGTEPSLPDQGQLVKVIEMNSEPDEIILIEPFREMAMPYVSLPRQLPRPTLVSWKFTPNNPKQIMHWNELISFRRAFFEGGCSQPHQYPIRLLLTFQKKTLDKVKNCGEIIWQRENITLLRINHDIVREAR